jgi:hypothetical protein
VRSRDEQHSQTTPDRHRAAISEIASRNVASRAQYEPVWKQVSGNPPLRVPVHQSKQAPEHHDGETATTTPIGVAPSAGAVPTSSRARYLGVEGPKSASAVTVAAPSPRPYDLVGKRQRNSRNPRTLSSAAIELQSSAASSARPSPPSCLQSQLSKRPTGAPRTSRPLARPVALLPFPSVFDIWPCPPIHGRFHQASPAPPPTTSLARVDLDDLPEVVGVLAPPVWLGHHCAIRASRSTDIRTRRIAGIAQQDDRSSKSA